MLNKLLSNLPFNPSLIGQISFYAKRLRKETSIRRLSLVLLLLGMGIQLFAFLAPAQPTLATSNNDLINGGFSSRDQAWLHCVNNAEDFGTIAAHFGITCDNVGTAATVTLRSTDYNKQLFSMGRLPYGKAGEQPITIEGANNGHPLYLRYLWSWDSYAYSTYKALSGTTSKGLRFFILYNCGNLVFIGIPPITPPPPPPPPPPPQELSCSNLVMNVADRARVQLNQQVSVRGQAAGKNIVFGQTVDMHYDFIEVRSNKVVDSADSRQLIFQNGVANDTNAHEFSASKIGVYQIKLTVTSGSVILPGSATGNCLKQITVQRPCEEVVSSKDLALCLVPHKTAKNITQNVTNASGTTVKPGDVIEYALTVNNPGNVTVPEFVIQESISDVRDYADIRDLHGGKIDDNNVVSWPAVDVKAGQTIIRLITVQVKNSLPITPTSASDPGHFDCIMTNLYGDTIDINIPKNAVCVTQKVTTTLTNTGPGTSLIAVVAVTVVAGYFFARSRLLAQEVDLVRDDYAATGGL